MSETLKRAAELLREDVKMRELINAVALSRDEHEAVVARIDELRVLVADLERMAQAEPVAWLVERHAFRVSQHGQDADGNDWLEVTNDGEAEAFPVYPAPPLPRDVLMAVAREVQRAAIQSCDEAGGDMGALHGIDLDAIVDLHAAQAAAEPASTKPVNKQLLSVLKRIVDTCNSADFDGEPSAAEMKAAEEAIAAAKSAQAQQERIAKDAALIETMNRIAGLEGKAALHDQLMRACGDLPEGWEIVIELENGAGTVSLFDPAYREVEYPEDSENMAQAVEYAIDTAIAAQAQEGGAA